ncbi:MAG: alkaline phosphatase family protein [Flavobacteriaceae bacterium]
MTKSKVLLIGWDAADWKIIGPLIAKGEMPSLKSLIDRGVYGNMSTMNPPYSPMLWSTVATGKTPDKHGVLGFIEILPNLKGIRPVSASSRKSRALWNIFHNQGLKSNLVGWWPSFPAEPIKGNIVSDRFQKVKKNPNEKSPIIRGTVHPPELLKEISDLRFFPWEITEAHILPFIPNAAGIDQEKDQGLHSFAKIISENVSVHAASTFLQREKDWDFMAIYYDLIDHFCHAFMKFHPPKQSAIADNLYNIYKDAVVGAYKFQDMMLGRTLDLIDKENTTVIVMSDHGYESGNKRILKMPKVNAAPAMEHRQFGIFVAAGPNIKKNEKVFGLGLIDVCPTILHMYGLPIGKDMDGKVALDIFKKPLKPHYIDSWETVSGDFGEHKDTKEQDTLSDQETMQQLIELGYIDKPDDKIEYAIIKTSCDLKFNLARVFKGKKDFEQAKKLLLELVESDYPKITQNEIDEALQKDPNSKQFEGFEAGDSIVDKTEYYVELLSIAISEKKFDDAEVYLNIVKTTNKRISINLSLFEIKLLIGKGKPKKALEILNKRIEISPKGHYWFEAGKLYMKFNDFENAKKAFEHALTFEIDKAKYHQALANCLVRLEDYESATDHALTAIELVKYFPEAHYTLGEALEKLGDIENAKKAYEMASKLKPKTHFRAEKAIENINELSNNQSSTNKNIKYKHRKNQITIVSGLPRSGTSLMMQMLHHGGVSALTDDNRKPDISNPKGYFEYDPVMSIHKDNLWLKKAQNKSLKVVAPLLKFLDPKYRYKIVFMNRDLGELVKSQQKMIGKDTQNLPTRLFEAYKKQLSQVEIWANKEPGVEIIYVDYKNVINNPDEEIKRITNFLSIDLNADLMKECIDSSLYRNKS